MGELCNNSYKYQQEITYFFLNLIIDPISVLYLKNLLVLSVVEVFKTICFLPHFYQVLGVVEVCNISDIYHLSMPSIDIFMQETRVILFQNSLVLSIAKVLRNIRFFPHFYYCLQKEGV